MANYITIAPQYNPFSLQELLAIPMMYTEAYNKAQEQYDAYQDKVAALRAYAKDSPAAASMLNAYDTGIQDLTNAMASGRWNTNVANQSRRLRSLYREQIIPLSIGATAFDTYRQNRLKRNDGTLIGRNYTLEDFINNPTLEDNSLLGSAIQAEAMKAAAVDASSRQVTPQWKLDRTRGGQYYTAEVGNGYTSSERAAFLQNPNDSRFSSLTAIRQQLRDKLGYANRTKAEQEQIDNYITRGIYDSMVGNVQWHDAINHGYSRPTSTGGTGTSTGGNAGGSTSGRVGNFALGGHLFQDGGSLSRQSSYHRRMLPGDPYSQIGDVNQMTDAQYKDWLKWYNAEKKRLKLASDAEVIAYLDAIDAGTQYRVPNKMAAGSYGSTRFFVDPNLNGMNRARYESYVGSPIYADMENFDKYVAFLQEVEREHKPMSASEWAKAHKTSAGYTTYLNQIQKAKDEYVARYTQDPANGFARQSIPTMWAKHDPNWHAPMAAPDNTFYGFSSEADMRAHVNKLQTLARKGYIKKVGGRYQPVQYEEFAANNNFQPEDIYISISAMNGEDYINNTKTTHVQLKNDLSKVDYDFEGRDSKAKNAKAFGYSIESLTRSNPSLIVTGSNDKTHYVPIGSFSREVREAYYAWMQTLKRKYGCTQLTDKQAITLINNLYHDEFMRNDLPYLDDYIRQGFDARQPIQSTNKERQDF